MRYENPACTWRIKYLTVADDFDHKLLEHLSGLGQRVRTSRGCWTRRPSSDGYPLAVRTDNGPEFLSRVFRGVRRVMASVTSW